MAEVQEVDIPEVDILEVVTVFLEEMVEEVVMDVVEEMEEKVVGDVVVVEIKEEDKNSSFKSSFIFFMQTIKINLKNGH